MSKLAAHGGTPIRTRLFPKWPQGGTEEIGYLRQVLEGTRWFAGPRGDDPEALGTLFGERFADRHYARFGLPVANGSVAIEIALRAAGIGPGDEVIVPAYTFVSTATSVLMVGAVPVFADIDPQHYCLDPEDAARRLTPRTRALLPVHLGGQMADMEGLGALARELYDRADRGHHNFQHVLRDLYRALLIAETEAVVNFSVLIPSVLLHDIGFFDPDLQAQGHEAAGAARCRDLLAGAGYSAAEIESIAHCILAHKGRAALPATLEARILYDADVLEKAGTYALILGGKLLCKFRENLEDYLARETRDRKAELAQGFYTAKARELDGGRLARTGRLLAELQQEVEVERRDFLVREKDLWTASAPSIQKNEGNAKP